MRAGDEELHALLDGGDLRDAGTWLVRRYAHEVHGLCSAMVRDNDAAEDLAQDVFSRAFSGLGNYRREASSRTWLLAIARNRCIDHLRSRGRVPFSDAEPDDAPDEAPLTSDLLSRRADVFRALAELDEGERALVVLRYRHGLSFDELANVFGLKAGTARMRVSRALSRMRGALSAAATDLLEAPPAPRRSAAKPAPPAGPAAARYGASRDEEAGDAEAEEAALDERADIPSALPVPSAPPPARSKSRSREAPKARGGILSRILGRKKEAPPEEFDDVTPVSPPPTQAGGGPPLEALDDITPVSPSPMGAGGGPPAPEQAAPEPVTPRAPTGTGQPPPPAAPAAAPMPLDRIGAPRRAPAPDPLAAFFRRLDPRAPESFTKRLFDLANRL